MGEGFDKVSFGVFKQRRLVGGVKECDVLTVLSLY
jgi:hypothetical protein